MTSFCRRLLQRLAFSESRHFSWDKDPARTMAYCTWQTGKLRDKKMTGGEQGESSGSSGDEDKSSADLHSPNQRTESPNI